MPLLDAELNAVSKAGLIDWAKWSGLRFATNFSINGSTIKA